MCAPGYVVHERYTIVNQIALGGSCTVFRARDPQSREVALKVVWREEGEGERGEERGKSAVESALC